MVTPYQAGWVVRLRKKHPCGGTDWKGWRKGVGRGAGAMGIAKCRRQGRAMVALRNGAHLGRIGTWAELAAAARF